MMFSKGLLSIRATSIIGGNRLRAAHPCHGWKCFLAVASPRGIRRSWRADSPVRESSFADGFYCARDGASPEVRCGHSRRAAKLVTP
jgi:hypothetical protein